MATQLKAAVEGECHKASGQNQSCTVATCTKVNE